MENKILSGPLREGYIVSKLRKSPYRCDKTLEEKDSVLFSNLRENCTVGVYSERAKKMEELAGCDGVILSDQGREGSNTETKCNMPVVSGIGELKEIRMSHFEGDSGFAGKNEAYVENVVSREDVDQGNDTLQLHMPDWSTKKEISDKGINLFVELLCSQDGSYEGRDTGDHILRGDNCKGNGALPSENVEIVSAMIDVDKVAKQVHEFSVGDLVWAKTSNQLWWPGMIRDPSNVAKDTTKSKENSGFFVKYFGNFNSLRCTYSNLKPFVEYFEEMSMQNNTSYFLGCIGKALSEIGRRVKAEMSCPCFLKESKKLNAQCSAESQEPNLMSKNIIGKSNVLSLSQFQPSNFLARVRNLSQGDSLPGKIELTIIQNRLSAFFCFVGHCQVPMLQLRPPIGDTSQDAHDRLTSRLVYEDCNNFSVGNRNFFQKGNDAFTLSNLGNRNASDDAEIIHDGKSTSSGKVHESRERKKSKYLSYPYVDVKQGLKTMVEDRTEGLKHVSGTSSNPTPPSKCSNGNTLKKVSGKPSKRHHKITKSDNVNASSAELLAELRLTALDCFYPNESKHSVKKFYCSFRRFTHLDQEKLQNCPEANIMPRKSKKKKEAVNSAGLKNNDSLGTSSNTIKNNLPVIGYQEMGSDVPKRDKTSLKRKKVGATPKLPQVDHFASHSFGTSTNNVTSNSSMIACQETGSDVSREEKTSKKREVAEATPELPQVNTIDGLPDLNGTILSFSVETMLFGGTCTPKGKLVPKRKKEGLTSPCKNAVDSFDEDMNSFKAAQVLKDVQITVQSNSQLNNGADLKDAANLMSADSTARDSEVNVGSAGLGSLVQTSFPGVQSDFQPERKKRKRQAKTGPVASHVPDLNGDVSQLSSLGKDSSMVNAVSAGGKSISKRRRRRNKSDISGSNVNINKVSKKEEDFGAILLLNFVPGCPPPSKEALIPIFNRFGLLKESETWVLNNSTAQIAYERRSDGEFAVRSLEKSNPFGASLASFQIHLPGASQTAEYQNSVQTTYPIAPIKARRTLAKPREAPDLVAMRQNVEMMKSVLEKEGDNLSPQTRTKLENEIKGFLHKISTMVGSSPS